MTALMSLALDGLLDAEDQLELQQHLVGCSACAAEYETMQQVSALFEEAPMVGPPLGFAVRVERRLEEKERKRRRLFGSVAIVTSSLSLAGVTVATVSLIIFGLLAFQGFGGLPTVEQSSSILSLVASGIGIVGKGATLFLGDLLMRYGPPLLLLLGVGLAFLVGMWIWLFVKRPGQSQRNGYI
jgi:predicted anti-sigma-YlaC factor YlaD